MVKVDSGILASSLHSTSLDVTRLCREATIKLLIDQDQPRQMCVFPELIDILVVTSSPQLRQPTAYLRCITGMVESSPRGGNPIIVTLWVLSPPTLVKARATSAEDFVICLMLLNDLNGGTCKPSKNADW